MTTANDILIVKSKSNSIAGSGITIMQTITTKPIARTISLLLNNFDNLPNSIQLFFGIPLHQYHSNIIIITMARALHKLHKKRHRIIRCLFDLSLLIIPYRSYRHQQVNQEHQTYLQFLLKLQKVCELGFFVQLSFEPLYHVLH